jgi:hypothetical protein
VPVIPVQSALQVGIPLSLKEVVIVAFLVEVMHVVVLAVVADLLHHRANAGFVLADQLGVLQLLMFEAFRESLLLGEGTFEFGDAGG